MQQSVEDGGGENLVTGKFVPTWTVGFINTGDINSLFARFRVLPSVDAPRKASANLRVHRCRMLPSVRPLGAEMVLRACMGVRGSDPKHYSVLAHIGNNWFSDPVSPTVVPYSPSIAYLLRQPQ